MEKYVVVHEECGVVLNYYTYEVESFDELSTRIAKDFPWAIQDTENKNYWEDQFGWSLWTYSTK